MFRTTPRIELVSLHIPKTAGTSFRNILKSIYGDPAVVRVDIPIESERASHEKAVQGPARLPRGVRVLHGHFRVKDLRRHYGLAEGIPVVTWLRDPVERVISNYFYLQQVLRGILDEKKRSVAILNKMERTLLEYARAEIARNRVAKFLDGMKPGEFFFIGVQEYFEEDLAELAAKLAWKKPAVLCQNTSDSGKALVSEEMREEIRRLNERDAALYEEALALRKQRRKPQEALL